jgi:predicted Zn finger-like uncharacterized protein
MKIIKCGKCQTAYKINESLIKSSRLIVTCKKCNAKNNVKFTPILLIQSKGEKQRISLSPGKYVIGRNLANTVNNISIKDQFVSRRHAELQVLDKEGKIDVTILDTRSTNGIFNKNKQKLNPEKSYPFIFGDYFIVGLTKLTLVLN